MSMSTSTSVTECVAGHLYIVWMREFMRSGANVFKVGRTARLVSRMYGYPKGSLVLMTFAVDDTIEAEARVMSEFKACFRQCREFGREYFQGDVIDMKRRMSAIADTFSPVSALSEVQVDVTMVERVEAPRRRSGRKRARNE